MIIVIFSFLSLLLSGLQSICADQLVESKIDHLLILGPSGSFEDQIKYLESTWPYNFSVNIVVAVSEPDCNLRDNSYIYIAMQR